jgi:predicted double-glycine peptidase
MTLKRVHVISILGVFAITIIAYSAFEKASSDEILKSVNKLGPISVSFTSVKEQKTFSQASPLEENTSLDTLNSAQIETNTEKENISDATTPQTDIKEETRITKQKKTDKHTQTPFYSQFDDITDPSWKKVGCGIASLAMIIEFYNPGEVSVDNLLTEGIKSGAYLNDAGWIHAGLIDLAQRYNLNGNTSDLSGLSTSGALEKLENTLVEGPVMASVHYTFDPKNPIPHLVVINKIVGDTVYYNDPSEKAGNGSISTTKFLKAWKKRYIELRPA